MSDKSWWVISLTAAVLMLMTLAPSVVAIKALIRFHNSSNYTPPETKEIQR